MHPKRRMMGHPEWWLGEHLRFFAALRMAMAFVGDMAKTTAFFGLAALQL